METLHNGFTLQIPSGCFPLSTDSMLLSDFAVLPKNARVLDLGSGCGTLGLLLCAKDDRCAITGVELSESAHDAAQQNILNNSLGDRMNSICADIRSVSTLFAPGIFDCCVSNPPYFSGGPASSTVPLARRDDCCTSKDLFRSAAWALKYGGTFFLVHKPERLAELCALASEENLTPKRLRLIRYRPDKEVSLILLACRKGGKPGLSWEELCLNDSSGQPTEEYKKLYHL